MSEPPDPTPLSSPDPSDTPAPGPGSGETRSFWTPLKKILALGALLLVGLHQPLLHWTLRKTLQLGAQRNGYTLRLQTSGNLFTRLQIQALHLTPTLPTPPTPPNLPDALSLETLSVARAELHYSLPRLFWSGPGECLTSYRLEDVQLQLQLHQLQSPPSPSAPSAPPNPSPSPSFAQQLETWLAHPALYADAVELRKLNVLWKIGNTPHRSLRNLDLTAYPDRPGLLKLEAFTQTDSTQAPQPLLQALEATTSYPKRHLTLSKLRLLPDLELTALHFDASERSLGKGAFSAELRFHNQPLRVACSSQRPRGRQPAQFRIELAASHFAAQELLQLLQLWQSPSSPPSSPPSTPPHRPQLGEIEWAEAHLQGDPRAPASWEGEADLRAQLRLHPESAPLNTEVHVAFHAGSLLFDAFKATLDTNSAALTGQLRLPPSLEQWDQINGTLKLSLDLEDFAALGLPAQSIELQGSGHLSATLNLHEGRFSSTWHAEAQASGSRPFACSQAQLEGELQGPLRPFPSLEGLSGKAQATLQAPSLQHAQTSLGFQEASLQLTLQDRILTLGSLKLASGENRILGSGRTALAEHPLQFTGDVQVHLPELGKLAWVLRGHPLSGHLQGSGKGSGTLENNLAGLSKASGVFSGKADKLRWGDFEVGQASAQTSLENGKLTVETLSLRWDPENTLEVAGHFGLQAPHPYQLRSQLQLAKLERLEPLLRQCGIPSNLTGQLTARGSGQGTLQPPSGQGTWELLLKNGRWKSAELKEVACSVQVSPGEFKAAPLRIITPQTRFNAELLWKEGTLRIQEIALQQWGYPALSGYLVLPLDWNASGPVYNPNSRLSGQLQAHHLDLVSLFAAAGQPAALAGRLDCGLVISGSPVAPELSFELTGQELRLPSHPGLGHSELKLHAHLHEHRLALEASLQSPLTPLKKPVQFEAQLPVDLPKLLSGQQSFSELPLEARLQVPKANLALLPSFWNGFKKFEGSLQLEAALQGSLTAPRWKGSLQLDAPVIHFVSYRFPAIADLRLQLHFDQTALHLQQLRGNVGGGTVSAQGSAQWTQPGKPLLDFHAIAKEMLVVRGRELSLRLDGDLHLKGPWESATISGLGYAVKSRVIRDIELLPSTVLKRVASPLPTANPGKPWFTFPRFPFSEWKWDVALKTRPEDPLLIRGNRLHGSAHADLHLRGTGAAPTLEGHYTTSDLVAFLPFARIAVNRGHFWYFPNQPFRTQLDFSAESEVRQHRIRLYVTGTPEVPKVNLSSDPPLPESDLLNLLTTGILPSDTNENGQAMAGRAAAVLFQELSGKLFDYSSNRERASTLQRFNLNVGAINTRTGHQETTLSYRLSDQFFILGELGANGDFGGQIKYLIRFR